MHHPGIDVAPGTQVQLLRPSALRVQVAEQQHKVGGEPVVLLRVSRVTASSPVENGNRPRLRTGGGIAVRKTMVGEPPSRLVERFMAPRERLDQIPQAHDCDVCLCPEPVDPRVENRRLVHLQRTVRTEGRVDPGPEPGSPNRLMVLQRIGGIVCRAERPYVELAEDAVGGEGVILEPLTRAFPDARGCRRIEKLRDVEVSLQLEVRPVIQRVPQALRDGLRPGEKFVVGWGVTGAVPFVQAVRTHRPPLVVVPFQPDLEQIREPPVPGNVARREVAVVVQDRLCGRMPAVQVAGRLRVQQEVI